jgi:hypothetical protein
MTVEDHFTPTDLNTQDEAPRSGDEGKGGLSPERELGLENGLGRSNESSDMRSHLIGDFGETSRA